MTRSRVATLGFALAAGCALPAEAATLLAPPVLAPQNDQLAVCSAMNTSETKALDVTIELFDPDGTVLDTSTSTLDPLNTRSLTSDPGPLAAGCRISFQGGAKRVRGALMLMRIGIGTSETLVVVPVE